MVAILVVSIAIIYRVAKKKKKRERERKREHLIKPTDYTYRTYYVLP